MGLPTLDAYWLYPGLLARDHPSSALTSYSERNGPGPQSPVPWTRSIHRYLSGCSIVGLCLGGGGSSPYFATTPFSFSLPQSWFRAACLWTPFTIVSLSFPASCRNTK